MENVIALMTSPASGPFWGLVGIMVTQVANVVLTRKKNANEIAATHLTAINDASKQLIESLFQTMKTQGEQIEKLQKHTEECETQHRETLALLDSVQNQLNRLQEATGTSQGAE